MLLAFNVTNTDKPGAGVLATSIPDVFKAMETYGTAGSVKDISAVYNGKLTLKTGTSVTYDGFPTQVFKRETVNLPAAGTDPAVIAAVDFCGKHVFHTGISFTCRNKRSIVRADIPLFRRSGLSGCNSK